MNLQRLVIVLTTLGLVVVLAAGCGGKKGGTEGEAGGPSGKAGPMMGGGNMSGGPGGPGGGGPGMAGGGNMPGGPGGPGGPGAGGRGMMGPGGGGPGGPGGGEPAGPSGPSGPGAAPGGGAPGGMPEPSSAKEQKRVERKRPELSDEEIAQLLDTATKAKDEGDIDAAMAAVTKVIASEPQNVDANWIAAWLLAEKDDTALAIGQFERVLKLGLSAGRAEQARAAINRLKKRQE